MRSVLRTITQPYAQFSAPIGCELCHVVEHCLGGFHHFAFSLSLAVLLNGYRRPTARYRLSREGANFTTGWAALFLQEFLYRLDSGLLSRPTEVF